MSVGDKAVRISGCICDRIYVLFSQAIGRKTEHPFLTRKEFFILTYAYENRLQDENESKGKPLSLFQYLLAKFTKFKILFHVL